MNINVLCFVLAFGSAENAYIGNFFGCKMVSYWFYLKPREACRMQNSAIGNETKFDCISDQISAFMPLDDKRSKSSPLNSKLQSALRRAIEYGVLGHGDQLPTETQLSRSFGVPLKTVKNALEKNGWGWRFAR